MATLHLTVLKNRQNSNGKYLVYIALTQKRVVRYIPTEYEIDGLYQFEKGLVVCRKDAKTMNQRLKYVLSEYQERLDGIVDSDIYECSLLKSMIAGRVNPDRPITIKELFENRIKRLIKEKRNSYAGMNEYTLGKILSIIGNITLRDISPNTIERFIAGMSNLSNATKQMRLTHFKAAINEAIKDGVVKYNIHPFVYTKMPKSNVKLIDITIEEFQSIRDLNTKHRKLSLAKDLFLLSFYLGGINLVDLVDLDFNSDTIRYERKKTSNKKQGTKEVILSIPEEAKAIIAKYKKRNGKLDFGYKFTYSNFQRYLNLCIKKLEGHLNIKTSMCYYSARKTFSQFAFDLGIRTEIIEYCIGQSMKENRPIYNYVRVMQKQADLAIRKVIDYTEHPENYELNIMVV